MQAKRRRQRLWEEVHGEGKRRSRTSWVTTPRTMIQRASRSSSSPNHLDIQGISSDEDGSGVDQDGDRSSNGGPPTHARFAGVELGEVLLE
jgi:hypothetical protein